MIEVGKTSVNVKNVKKASHTQGETVKICDFFLPFFSWDADDNGKKEESVNGDCRNTRIQFLSSAHECK